MEDDATKALGNLLPMVREQGLVVLAGAGISMAPPTSLPSWWDFNAAVLQALADRLEETTSQGWASSRLDVLIQRRNTLRAFTPDFMAQVMAEEAGTGYFRVLQALDSDQCNANHDALADLAKAGLIRAIITTNFDRLIEISLTARGVSHSVFADTDSFEKLPDVLDDPEASLSLIKAHGTVSDHTSMVDTLAQRVAGRPASLEQAIHTLLQRSPCLVLGFSGADLAYDPDYLSLRPAAQDGVGLTVLVRPDTEPREPMRELVATWGARGAFVTGTLPEWLVALRDALGAAPASPDAPTSAVMDLETAPWSNILAERCRAWVDSLGTVPALNMFTSLVDTGDDDEQMLRYLMFFRRYYRSTEDARAPTYWRFEYNLGRRLLDRGLIGTIDAQEAGLVGIGRDVEAKDYVDAFQFLARSAEPGAMPEAKADLMRYLALKLGHGHVDGSVNVLIKELFEGQSELREDRRALEVCWLASEFAEEFGRLEAALLYVRAAYGVARVLGDEPRRGAIAARAGRIAALRKEYGDAAWLASEALQISSHLSLPVLRGDALAAQGMLEVLRSRDDLAVAPLNEACTIFRRLKRRPRLTYALCDLARACYYSGLVDDANASIEEARGLAVVLPGLEVQVLQVVMELLADAQQWDLARSAATDLLVAATDLKHEAGIKRAHRTLERIDQHAGTAQ